MITEEKLKLFFKSNPYQYEDKKEIDETSEIIEIHTEGESPRRFLDLFRPNELEHFKQYRIDNFEPITKTYFEKVFNALGKIRNADDFFVKFKDTNNELYNYTQKNFPGFDDFESYAFTVVLRMMLQSPNGVICIYPKELPKTDNSIMYPCVEVIESEYVYDYETDDFCAIKSDEYSKEDEQFFDLNPVYKKVDRPFVWMFFDENQIQRYVQHGDPRDYTFVQTYQLTHNFGYMPCWRLGGTAIESDGSTVTYESFIQGCIPFWNKAIKRDSDHEVNMALHLHPEKWEIADEECKTCKGSGVVTYSKQDGTAGTKTCGTCNGKGSISTKTPFGVKLINVSKKRGANEADTIPTPPFGYAQRPIESLDFLKKEIRDNIKDGLAAISMEFLMETPINESGKSKQMDRQELYTFVGNVANMMIKNIIAPSYYFMNRYINYGKANIDRFLPQINVPKKFDIIYPQEMQDAIKKAVDSNMPNSVIGSMQLHYAAKEFGYDSESYSILKDQLMLDPLQGKTVDEKMVELTNGGCTKEQYIISTQITSFLVRAKFEHLSWSDYDYKKKVDVLNGYANEIKTAVGSQQVVLM